VTKKNPQERDQDRAFGPTLGEKTSFQKNQKRANQGPRPGVEGNKDLGRGKTLRVNKGRPGGGSRYQERPLFANSGNP